MSPNEVNDHSMEKGLLQSSCSETLISGENEKGEGLTSQTGKEKQVVLKAFALRQRSMQEHRAWRPGFQISVPMCVF